MVGSVMMLASRLGVFRAAFGVLQARVEVLKVDIQVVWSCPGSSISVWWENSAEHESSLCTGMCAWGTVVVPYGSERCDCREHR